MAITGGIKFFDINAVDSSTGATATATSGDPSAPFVLDRNTYTVWRSVGSDDTTTETLTILLPGVTIAQPTRIFLIGHNFKEFDLEYRNSIGVWLSYSGAILGVNGVAPSPGPGISENAYSFNTAYYETSNFTITGIRINVLKTQTPNEEKYLNSLVLSTELGTLQGYPNVRDTTKDKKLRKSILLNGRSFIDKSLEVFKCSLDFKNYPPTYTADLDLLYELFDRDENFYIWLCGGRAGDPYFKYAIRGFRLNDLILSQAVNIFKDSYYKNIYPAMVNLKLDLEEAS